MILEHIYAAGGGDTSCPILCKSNNGHRVQMQKCIPLVIQTHTSYCLLQQYMYVCLCFLLDYHLLLFLLHASKNWKATAFQIGEVLHSCICIYYVFQEMGLHCRGIMIDNHWQGKQCFSRLSSPRAKRAGPKGLRAESARAFTCRRNSHSGKGEDFLSRQPNFFTETAVTPERKVEKWFPRWEINRHAEG